MTLVCRAGNRAAFGIFNREAVGETEDAVLWTAGERGLGRGNAPRLQMGNQAGPGC